MFISKWGKTNGGVIGEVANIDFNVISPETTYKNGRLFWDKNEKTLGLYNDITGTTLQIGREMRTRVQNNTGSLIPNGSVVLITTGGGTIPNIQLANAQDESTSTSTLGFTTHDIANGSEGEITNFGLVRDLDTSSYSVGDVIYLSDSVSGEFVGTAPATPSWSIQLGQVLVSDAVNGEIVVNIHIGNNLRETFALLNGAILESAKLDVTSNGTTVTATVEKNGGGNLNVFFSDGIYRWDTTPADSITLTTGTDTVPVENYIYLDKATKLLTVNTTGYPATEHAPIGTVILKSALTTQTEGALKVHAWTDHISGTNNTGHLSHLNYWIRKQNATWQSGVSNSLNITTNASAPDNVDILSSSGIVLQLHPHEFPAFDTASGDTMICVNYPSDAYKTISDINELLVDSTGASMSGRYFNIVLWGVVSEDSEDCHLMINLPSGSYPNSTDAKARLLGYANTSIPTAFKGTGFLIAMYTLGHKTANGGTWTLEQTRDLRGVTPSATGGGSTITSITEFSDALFNVYNSTDPTKIIKLSAGTISTGNTRTYSVPDINGELVVQNSANGYIEGNRTINGSLTILGDIIQNGAPYETHAEQVLTTKDLIITRDGAISGLGAGEYTGFTAKLYDGVNDGQLVFDNTGVARVGDIGSLQALATREDTPTNQGIMVWDNATSKMVTDIDFYYDISSNFLVLNGALRLDAFANSTIQQNYGVVAGHSASNHLSQASIGSIHMKADVGATGSGSVVLQAGSNIGLLSNSAGHVLIGGYISTDTDGSSALQVKGNSRFENSSNGFNSTAKFLNNSTGSGAGAYITVGQDNVNQNLRIQYFNSAYSGVGLNASNRAMLSSGSSATNGLAFVTEASAPIIFATGGVFGEKMRLHSSGNLSIGDSTDYGTHKLQLSGSQITYDTSTAIDNTDSIIIRSNAQNATGTATASNSLLFLGAANNVVARVKAWHNQGSNSVGRMSFELNNNSSVIEVMRLMDTGNVLIGSTTDAGQTFQVYGTTALKNSAGNNIIHLKSDGYMYLERVQTGTGTNLVISNTDGQILKDSSSERYKDNIRSYSYNPYDVLGVNIREYEFRSTGQWNCSPTAEETINIAKRYVFLDANGLPDAIAEKRILWDLLLVVKDLKTRIDVLENV